MIVGKIVSALAVALSLVAAPARAQDALVTYKSLSPELALDLARAALGECRKRGYQAAVAVVDRFGVIRRSCCATGSPDRTRRDSGRQGLDRSELPHQHHRSHRSTQPGMPQAGLRNYRAR